MYFLIIFIISFTAFYKLFKKILSNNQAEYLKEAEKYLDENETIMLQGMQVHKILLIFLCILSSFAAYCILGAFCPSLINIIFYSQGHFTSPLGIAFCTLGLVIIALSDHFNNICIVSDKSVFYMLKGSIERNPQKNAGRKIYYKDIKKCSLGWQLYITLKDGKKIAVPRIENIKQIYEYIKGRIDE